ncbi:hypothetical protein NKH41_19955 [Mesorhizobium sp. M1169]|uniref:hypothetical protein n=1 Tax=Mesorhizobium sp. M1169 TaxID=2957066 RepID=UPI0033359067
MNELLGLYSDHRMVEPVAIAQRSSKVKPLATDLKRKGVLLVATCARIEIYGEEPALKNVTSAIFSNLAHGRIEGAPAIAQRLAEIASAAHSQILGESYISDQLEKAIEPVDPNFPIFQIARSAIAMGRAARERQRFVATFDYDQIVRDIVADRFANEELPDRLYIIGAGMLGRGLIRSGVGKQFRSTVVVTRNPKNLRRRLRRSIDMELALMRPAEIGYAREPRSIVVIGTADVNDEYEATLQDALLRLEPRVILDLSSIPVLSEAASSKLNYVTMYDKEFLRYIEKNNIALAPKLPVLLSDIKERLQKTQIYSPLKVT